MHSDHTTGTEIVLIERDGEPLARDIDIGERLGFGRARDIRQLIEANMAEIEGFGLARRHTAPIKSGKGRTVQVEEYWLNEEQALLVATLSKAPKAAEVRAMLIRTFVAWRRGHLAPAAPVAPVASHGLAREARLFLKQAMGVAKLAGLTGNSLLIAANRATRAAVGFDHMDAMGVRHLEAPDQDVLLTATDIGQQLGAISAVRVNHLLQEHGFQTGMRDAKGRGSWLPTEKGIAAGGQMVETERSNKTGQARQLRWASRIVETLRDLIEGQSAGPFSGTASLLSGSATGPS